MLQEEPPFDFKVHLFQKEKPEGDGEPESREYRNSKEIDFFDYVKDFDGVNIKAQPIKDQNSNKLKLRFHFTIEDKEKALAIYDEVS